METKSLISKISFALMMEYLQTQWNLIWLTCLNFQFWYKQKVIDHNYTVGTGLYLHVCTHARISVSLPTRWECLEVYMPVLATVSVSQWAAPDSVCTMPDHISRRVQSSTSAARTEFIQNLWPALCTTHPGESVQGLLSAFLSKRCFFYAALNDK